MSLIEELDLERFNSIIDEYSSSFKNPPKNAHQLVQFCKDKQYNHKYGELNSYFSIWRKQSSITKGNDLNDLNGSNDSNDSNGSNGSNGSNDDDAEINWDSFWNEYQSKYQYPPKKAIHLWNFAKEEKFLTVKYKEARIAFDRIHREKIAISATTAPIEGRSDLRTKQETETDILILKITKYTSAEDVIFIKSKFLELLETFRRSILHDPVSPLQLFNFINEDTQYKVRYGDVKKCYNYAVKHKWFKPMKRMKKHCKKNKKGKQEITANIHESEGADAQKNNDGEGVEFILEIDHEAIEKEKKLKEEEEQKETVILDVMTDDQYDDILIEYNNKYKNPPRNASQIMNFAKEIGQIFKYKACRIAFNRWKNYRGAVMPKSTKKEEEEEQPGTVEKNEEDQEEEEEEESD